MAMKDTLNNGSPIVCFNGGGDVPSKSPEYF